MTDTGMRSSSAGTSASWTNGRADTDYDAPTGWVGWNVFAAVMMLIAGSLQIIYGVIAVVNDTWVVWGHRADLYVDLTTWGWVHVGVGAAVFLAGLGVMRGNVLARAVGVLIAALSLIANFLFLPAYPLWSITVMVLDALVIWALTAHGHEMRDLRRARSSSEIDLGSTVPTP